MSIACSDTLRAGLINGQCLLVVWTLQTQTIHWILLPYRCPFLRWHLHSIYLHPFGGCFWRHSQSCLYIIYYCTYLISYSMTVKKNSSNNYLHNKLAYNLCRWNFVNLLSCRQLKRHCYLVFIKLNCKFLNFPWNWVRLSNNLRLGTLNRSTNLKNSQFQDQFR